MADGTQMGSQDKKPIKCYFRVSIGGEILSKDIVIELDIQNCPKTCESFLSLCVDSGSIRSDTNDDNSKRAKSSTDSHIRTNRRSPQQTYRGCEFHRVVPGLCVQAGDWERFDGTGGFSPLYGRNWKDEEGTRGGKIENKHDREGIVSMANAGKPNTNGSQFFVTLKPTPHLNGKHTVFGRVVSGMESVRKMADVERGEKDRPVSLQRIVIEDCGLLSLGRKHNSSKNNDKEDDDRLQRRKKKSKKRERKKHGKKRHRHRHRHRRDDSSGSDSYSSDDSNGNIEDSNSEIKKGSRRERHSRKHRKNKRRRKSHENHDSNEDDESLASSTNDGNGSSGEKHRSRRSSRDENSRSDRKKRDRDRKRRRDDERRPSSMK